MASPRRAWTNEQMDWIIGAVLRAGVTLAALTVLAGGALYLVKYGGQIADYRAFHGEPTRLRTVSGIVTSALSLSGRGIIELGLLLLILTPVARVAFSVAAFAWQRDRTYVVVTLIVLAVLLCNLVGGYR
jgi:uncharacterized membrane protein